jgi:peptide/nickel transport system substrate-binding protein
MRWTRIAVSVGVAAHGFRLQEMDPVKRAAMFIRMNDLLIQNVVVIPVVWRNGVGAANARLHGMALSGWDSTFWNLAGWHKV